MVRTIIETSDNKYLIGGQFTTYKGFSANFITQLLGVSAPPPPFTYSYTVDPTDWDYGILLSGATEPTKVVNIENTGTGTLEFTFTDSTNFESAVTGITILESTTSGVTINAKTNVERILSFFIQGHLENPVKIQQHP